MGFDFGLDEYPVVTEEYRKVLNKLILDHYRFSEIAHETASKFKHHLNTWMNTNMAGYTQKVNMFLEYDITNMSKITETFKGKDNGTSTSEGSDTGKVTEVESGSNVTQNAITTTDEFAETPSGKVIGNVFNNYLTTANRFTDNGRVTVTDNGNSTTTSTNDNESFDNYTDNSEYTKEITQPLSASDLIEFHAFISNVEAEILEDLSFLFIPFQTGVDYYDVIGGRY